MVAFQDKIRIIIIIILMNTVRSPRTIANHASALVLRNVKNDVDECHVPAASANRKEQKTKIQELPWMDCCRQVLVYNCATGFT